MPSCTCRPVVFRRHSPLESAGIPSGIPYHQGTRAVGRRSLATQKMLRSKIPQPIFSRFAFYLRTFDRLKFERLSYIDNS